MTIEEKAKAYDKALEVAQRFYNNSAAITKKGLEDIFPELVESEDERIKKQIIYAIKELHVCDETKRKCIAWLEKKGEQKTAIFIPKFRVGDKLVSTKNPRLTYEVLEVGHINELGNPEYKVDVFTDGKVSNPRNIYYMECYKVDEWAKLVERKNAEWSEEDEQLYNDLSDTYFYNDEDYPEETYKLMLKRVLDWMTKRAKFLTHQSHWKPSDEQMKALNEAIYHVDDSIATQIAMLIGDLRKL